MPGVLRLARAPGIRLSCRRGIHCHSSTEATADLDDGVPAPRPVRLAIGEAVPQVDNGAATHVDAARRADLARVVEVRAERVGNLPQPSSTQSSPSFLDALPQLERPASAPAPSTPLTRSGAERAPLTRPPTVRSRWAGMGG